MIGNLHSTVETLLKELMPGLLGGSNPPVQLSVIGDRFEIDQYATDGGISEPRPDDRTDQFPWNGNNPAGPYALTQSPYPLPRRVYLKLTGGDLLPLREDEVRWDQVDSRSFSLNLRPNRSLTDVTGVQALYGVTAVFTRLKALQTVMVQLQSTNPTQLDEAAALAIAILELNRDRLIETARAAYQQGDYGAMVQIKTLKLLQGNRSEDGKHLLVLESETELKATRTLGSEEGAPIQRILSPGRTGSAAHPVDINLIVEG
ncbi:hypothetical protein K9N68_03635 [Kovacikia minuta CCNUW1]|uniref:hypothetical protein n=1 Tax=Kovacikia minuta TaxID=2931930 RepID=UPI001CCD8C2A|nr:hypothetical protein [Kovacikia minuta]UBF27074.1 hypothetical protein K9N68_03635 [Kovacikia minuta CCNUW1]